MKSATSNNYNKDIVVFKNICKILWNESPIMHFSFYYKPYEVYTVKKTCQLSSDVSSDIDSIYELSMWDLYTHLNK